MKDELEATGVHRSTWKKASRRALEALEGQWLCERHWYRRIREPCPFEQEPAVALWDF